MSMAKDLYNKAHVWAVSYIRYSNGIYNDIKVFDNPELARIEFDNSVKDIRETMSNYADPGEETGYDGTEEVFEAYNSSLFIRLSFDRVVLNSDMA